MSFENIIMMTDLDGTLLNDEKKVSDTDMAAINEFRAGGGLFTVATGRGVAMAQNVVERLEIDIPCVIFNGAAVYDFNKSEFLWHSSMPECAADYMWALADRFPDIGIEILHSEKVYVVSDNLTVEEHMAIESITPVYCAIDEAPKENLLKILIAYPPEKIHEVIEFTRVNCSEVRKLGSFLADVLRNASKGHKQGLRL